MRLVLDLATVGHRGSSKHHLTLCIIGTDKQIQHVVLGIGPYSFLQAKHDMALIQVINHFPSFFPRYLPRQFLEFFSKD